MEINIKSILLSIIYFGGSLTINGSLVYAGGGGDDTGDNDVSLSIV